jgi:hypothetical protein
LAAMPYHPLSPQGSFYLQTKVRVYNSSHIIFQLLKHSLLGFRV